jgi:hypothetical protein
MPDSDALRDSVADVVGRIDSWRRGDVPLGVAQSWAGTLRAALAAAPPAPLDVERQKGRIEAFDDVLSYLITINGNGFDEPREPALDAVYDKVRKLRRRAALAATEPAAEGGRG